MVSDILAQEQVPYVRAAAKFRGRCGGDDSPARDHVATIGYLERLVDVLFDKKNRHLLGRSDLDLFLQ